jgi:hypothetical protein
LTTVPTLDVSGSVTRIRRARGGLLRYATAARARMPDELHLEVRRYPRRVEPYWNGCAWVI